LTWIADSNKAVGDESTAHRKHIENEIQVTAEYLAWINNRRIDINKRRETLREQRCYANLMFVKALKEHDEALEVVRFLREDVAAIVDGSRGNVDLAQLKDASSKLSAYAHLFNTNAMKEFAQLTNGDIQDVDEETAAWDDRASDNSRDGLALERQTAGTAERDIGSKFLRMIDTLEQNLIQAMADLKSNEIQAAWDLVSWLQDSEAELEHLDEEQAAKTTYQDKLLISIISAKAHEDQAWEIYFESASTLNNAIDDLNAKREFWAAEKSRRDEENKVLDEIIQMFIDRVSGLDAGMKNKVNDFTADHVFDNSDIARKTDAQWQKDHGKLAGNVASEAAL